MWHHKHTHDTIFLTLSLIGSINDNIIIFTNRREVLMELKSLHCLSSAGQVVLGNTWTTNRTDLHMIHTS